MEPSPPTATMLLGAVLSDTMILNSATTTERDRLVVEYLERVLEIDAADFGRQMFEATSDVSEVSAEEIVSRDAKQYHVGSGHNICIAQIEVVGKSLLDRSEELIAAMRKARESRELQLYALMVTDVLTKGTDLLVAGDVTAVARAFGVDGPRQQDRAAGRDEPQERGRAEAAGDASGRTARATRRRRPRPPTARAGASPHSCSSR